MEDESQVKEMIAREYVWPLWAKYVKDNGLDGIDEVPAEVDVRDLRGIVCDMFNADMQGVHCYKGNVFSFETDPVKRNATIKTYTDGHVPYLMGKDIGLENKAKLNLYDRAKWFYIFVPAYFLQQIVSRNFDSFYGFLASALVFGVVVYCSIYWNKREFGSEINKLKKRKVEALQGIAKALGLPKRPAQAG